MKRILLLAAICGVALPAFAQSTPANPRGQSAVTNAANAAQALPPVTNAYGAQTAALGNSDKATFTYVTPALAMTATDDAIFIKAGPSLVTRVRRVCIVQPGILTGAAVITPTLVLRSTASSSCTNANAAPGRVDSTQGAQYSGSVNSLCTTQGTATDTVWVWSVSVPTAIAAYLDPKGCVNFDDGQFKSPTVAPNTGIGLSWPGAAGGASAVFAIMFTEEPQ